jgi:hypothetical protein
MKITHLIGCTALAAALGAGAAWAGSDEAGTTAAGFLGVGTSPSILARGGATLGLAGDIAITSWNAGSLGFLKDTQIALSHATLIDQTTQEYLAAGGRMIGSDLRWSLSGLYEGEGSFAGRDALNNSTGTFNVSSFAAGGHLAYPIFGVGAVGVGAKWVNESLGGASRGAGLTFDGGVQVHAGMVGLGIAAQNVGGQMRFGSQKFDFPTNYGVGVALDHAASGLRVAVDANFPTSYYNDVRTGVEWRWRDLLAVRAGYRKELAAPSNEALSGPTFGFGAGAYGMWFDYGYIVPGSGDGQHRIGITLRPSRMNLGGGGMGRAVSSASPDGTAAEPGITHKKSGRPLQAKADPGVTTEPMVPSTAATPASSGAAAASIPAQPSPTTATPPAFAPMDAAPVFRTPPSQAEAPAAPAIVAKKHTEKPKHAVKKLPPVEAQTLPPAAQVQPLPPPAPPAQEVSPAPAVAQAAADEANEAKAHKDKKAKPAKDEKPKKAEAKPAPKPASDDPFEAAIERAKGMNAGNIKAKIK